MYYFLLCEIRNTVSSRLSNQGTEIVWLLSDRQLCILFLGLAAGWSRAEQRSCCAFQPGREVQELPEITVRGAGMESRLRRWLKAARVLKYLLSLITKIVPQHWHQRVNRVIAGMESKLILVLVEFFCLFSFIFFVLFISVHYSEFFEVLPTMLFFSSKPVFSYFEIHSSIVAPMLIKHSLMVMFISICGSLAPLLNVVPLLSSLFSPSLLACPILYISLLEGLIPQFFLWWYQTCLCYQAQPKNYNLYALFRFMHMFIRKLVML